MSDFFKNKCEVVRDLIPLYTDKGTAPETAALISRHISECHSCHEYFKRVKKCRQKNRDFSDVVGIPDYQGFLKKLRRRRIAEDVLFSALVVSLVTNIAYLCLPDSDDKK